MSEKQNNLKIQNKDLQKYINELNDDIKLDMYNLKEKALMSSSIWSKWISYLYKEKENLSRISELKKKILDKKISEIKTNDSILRLKSEEKISENDENIKKLNLLFKNTQNNIDYIERALSILSNFGFSIKNVIEILKLNLNH